MGVEVNANINISSKVITNLASGCYVEVIEVMFLRKNKCAKGRINLDRNSINLISGGR